MATNVPAIEFTSTGPVIPAESAILSGVQADINAAFGGDVNPALETPQGQIASSETAIIGDKNSQVALIVNQVNPDYADGIFQDAIGRIYFLDRKPALPTRVMCDCVGAVGTIIAAGAKAQDTSNNLYACTVGGTIPVGGTISLEFTATKTGPIACPAGTVAKIYQTVPGWDTINNPADGILGNNVESRAEFEYRRRNSVALNAHGSLESVYAAVFNCEGVTDVYGAQNYTNATVTKGPTNYPLVEHSLYIAVVGGVDADIAAAIWLKKDLGCDCNGNTTVMVTDTTYAYPYPTYAIKFHRPDPLHILVAVSLVSDPSLPADIVSLVQAAIVSAFAGGDGGPAARIGSTLFASRFYAPVAKVSQAVSILSLLLGTDTATNTSVAVGIDQHPTISPDNIEVTLI